MRIDLIAVGYRMPAWIDNGFKEYKKRITYHIDFNLIEIKPAQRTKNTNTQSILDQEAGKIETTLGDYDQIIVLDETGKTINTKQLSARLNDWIEDQNRVAIIIGGADGLSDKIKQRTNQTWSLSAMTLPHGLVRVIVAEQLYRAWSILQNHPYHRE